MSLDSPNLWTHTHGYGATAPAVGFLDDAQNARLERIRVARMLWKGSHRRVYLDEGRTQFDFPDSQVNGKVIKPYVTLNVLRLISTTLTDLLLGEEPMLRADSGNADGQAAVSSLKTRSDLHRVFYDAARTSSWAAEAMVEIVRWDGEVWIQDVKPDDVFPIGPRLPDGQHAAYRRFATAKLSGDRAVLLETTYKAGLIERACFELNGGARGPQKDLAEWPVKRPDGTPLLPIEQTGIEWNSIVWMANELDEGRPTSDYDGLIELQDELNAKQTQIARVIAKHADPKLAAPETAADPQGNLPSTHSVFFYRTKDDIPSYITWNAELASAIADRDFTLNALCIASELSQGLLGLEQGAAPDSARKLRLQATKSLARMKRKSTFVRPFIRTAVETAMMMINAGNRVSLAMGGISIELRDGLPVDDADQATTISTLTGGRPAMSVKRAVELQLPDPEAAAKEIERLEEEAARGAPSVLIGEPGEVAAEPAPAAEATPAATPAEEEATVTGQELQTSQDTVLNGAQITSATAIVTAVSAGEMPRDAGLGQLELLFNLSPEQAQRMMGSAGTNVPTTPNPVEASTPAAEVAS